MKKMRVIHGLGTHLQLLLYIVLSSAADLRISSRLMTAICSQRDAFQASRSVQPPIKRTSGDPELPLLCKSFYRTSGDYGVIFSCDPPFNQPQYTERIMSHYNKIFEADSNDFYNLSEPCERLAGTKDDDSPGSRGGMKDENDLWINTITKKCNINVKFDPKCNAGVKKNITDTFLLLNAVLDKMTIATITQPTSDYIYVTSDPGCNAAIGRKGGRQSMNIQPTTPLMSVLHEFFHSLGVSHEHQRVDRLNSVTLDLTLVKQDYLHNFKLDNSEISNYGLPYNYESIMHYPGIAPKFWITTGQSVVVIRTKDPKKQNVIGQRRAVSQGDKDLLNAMYKNCQK